MSKIFLVKNPIDEGSDSVGNHLWSFDSISGYVELTPSLEQTINKFDGIENCLHNADGGDGVWIKEDGKIKCADCNRIFDSPAELVKDSNKHFFQKLRESVSFFSQEKDSEKEGE